MKPLVVESTEFEFLGASLDGLSDCGKYILEIKTGGYKLLQMAKDGVIPNYYMDQMQHQLLVTRADKCFYKVTHEEEEKELVIEVLPDPEFVNRFMPKAREFWRCVAFDEQPALVTSDYKDMSEEPLWRINAEHYKKICEEIKILEEVKENYRKQLLQLCKDQNCVGEGIKVMKTVMRGRIAYDEIPQIKDIDLDAYRKGSTTSWKVFIT